MPRPDPQPIACCLPLQAANAAAPLCARVVGADPEEYISTKRTLARLFQENFKKYEGGGGHLSADLAAAVLAAGPAL